MKYRFYLAFGSLLLNSFYLGLWTYISSSSDQHEKQVEQFERFLPFGSPLTSVLLILLSIFSMIIFARGEGLLFKVLAIIQAAFLFLLTWQFL